MKTIRWTNYGAPDVLQLHEIAQPMPKEDEILIKIHAATVTTGDCEVRSLKFPLWLALPLRLYIGIRKPRATITLGQDLAGEIVAAGKAVTQFKVGDMVYGTTGLSFGAYAEYTCLPANSGEVVLTTKPANMTYEEAATVPTGGLEALHFIRKINNPRGKKILIYGAGGSIGTYAVQLAQHLGMEVTALDSTAKMAMLRSLGVDQVIDYTQEDFTKRATTYDVVFDVVGKSPFAPTLKTLKPDGLYLVANPQISLMLRGFWVSRTSQRKVIFAVANQKAEDLVFLRELIEAGKLKAIIDRRYTLEQIVEAHRYVESGQKVGHVILTIVPTQSGG